MLVKDIERNETPDLCRECGGKCCKRYGCEWSIDDFRREFGEVTKENLISAIKTGIVTIDWWEGDYRRDYGIEYSEDDERDECHFIRSRHTNEPIGTFPTSWGGTCVSLTENGCKFDWEHRPLGGKSLAAQRRKVEGTIRYIEPTIIDCDGLNHKIDFVNEWFPYNDLLEQVKLAFIMEKTELEDLSCQRRNTFSSLADSAETLLRRRL